MKFLADFWSNTGIILLSLVVFFGLIVVVVIIVKKKSKFFKDDTANKIDEEKAVQEELDRVLEPVDDEETIKQFDEYNSAHNVEVKKDMQETDKPSDKK